MVPLAQQNRFEIIVRRVYEAYNTGDIHLPHALVLEIEDALGKHALGIKKKYQASGKPTPHLSKSAEMDRNLATIVESIRRCQEEGDPEYVNFVNIIADEKKHSIIYLMAGRGHPAVDAEAISNENLRPENQLNDSQIALLQSLGWNHPDTGEGPFNIGNFYRDDYDWIAYDDEDRMIIAQEIMYTFVEVYGISPRKTIEVELVLE